MGILKHFRPLCWEKIVKSVESFCTTLMGNDWKKHRTTKIEHCLYICYKNAKNRVCIYITCHVYVLVSWLQYVCPGEDISLKGLTQ